MFGGAVREDDAPVMKRAMQTERSTDENNALHKILGNVPVSAIKYARAPQSAQDATDRYQMRVKGSLACHAIADELVRREIALAQKGGTFLWPVSEFNGERMACTIARAWKFKRELRGGREVLNKNCGRFYYGLRATGVFDGEEKEYVKWMGWLDETEWAKHRTGMMTQCLRKALMEGFGTQKAESVRDGGQVWEEALARELDAAVDKNDISLSALFT